MVETIPEKADPNDGTLTVRVAFPYDDQEFKGPICRVEAPNILNGVLAWPTPFRLALLIGVVAVLGLGVKWLRGALES